MDEQKLKLREEQLNVLKRWVQTGEVSIRRELVKEVKKIIVPVVHEELVIRKKGDVDIIENNVEKHE